jgi:hypothetical protein
VGARQSESVKHVGAGHAGAACVSAVNSGDIYFFFLFHLTGPPLDEDMGLLLINPGCELKRAVLGITLGVIRLKVSML